MDDLIWNEFRVQHCTDGGVPLGMINFPNFRERMYTLHPEHRKPLKRALKKLVALSVAFKQGLTCPDSF
jgi:hypothetical protein